MNDKIKTPIIILGAGPAGLGAAYGLCKLGCEDWVICERDGCVGGLSRSVQDEHGFTWDIGGHVVFSHYGAFTRLLDDLLGPSGWLTHERESWIRMMDTWVPYPFQNNIHRLPKEVCASCLEGLINAATDHSQRPCENFDSFISQTFGEGIADVFMRPYNFKVWAYPPKEMDWCWIGERVALPDCTRVARNVVMQADDVSWGPNNMFRFPKTGGTGAIWTAIGNLLPKENIITGCEAEEVDTEAKIVRFSNGTQQPYGTLISTVPLDQLVSMTHKQGWIDSASGLKHCASHIIGVGLKGQPPPEMASKYWIYYPEDTTIFHRIIHHSLYSPNNVDDISKHWSLIAEVSESPMKPVDSANLESDVIAGLIRSGFIEDASQVTHTWVHRIEYSYPTPSLGRNKIIHSLLPELHEKDILSRGRFGAWVYEVGNMDHSFMQGYEAASHILHGTPELTLWHPHVVNQPHPVLGWDRYR